MDAKNFDWETKMKDLIDKKKGVYQTCPSCHGHGAFDPMLFCTTCKSVGLVKVDPTFLYTAIDDVDLHMGGQYFYLQDGEIKVRTIRAMFEVSGFPIFGSREGAERWVKAHASPKDTSNPVVEKSLPTKDYEILSHIDPDGKIITSHNQKHYIPAGVGLKYSMHEFPIHSVKRLSDGMVFTVGDEVYAWGGGVLRKIHGLYVSEGGHLTVKIDSDTGPTAMLLSLRKPERKSLFITEDGVEIHSGGTCWIIPEKPCAWDLVEINAEETQRGKRFSTREAAEEYVVRYSPVLSLNDVSETLIHFDIGIKSPVAAIMKLEKLAKERTK